MEQPIQAIVDATEKNPGNIPGSPAIECLVI
jgi:hypothetical protein